jgi:hypothetical protein
LNSIKVTLNDPSYKQSLEASNDFALRPASHTPNEPSQDLAPKSPSRDLGPKEPVPDIPAVAPSGPTLGGKGRGAQIMRQRQLMAQKAKEAEESRKGSADRQDS